MQNHLGRAARLSGGAATARLWRAGLRAEGNSRHLQATLQAALDAGLEAEQLDELASRAKSEGDNPMGLLLHWLAEPEVWRGVLTGNGGARRYRRGPAPSGPEILGGVVERLPMRRRHEA